MPPRYSLRQGRSGGPQRGGTHGSPASPLLPRLLPEQSERASRPAKPASGRKPEAPMSGYDRSEPKWRNWQTRRTQNPVPSGEWGFDSPLRHRSTTGLAGHPIFRADDESGNRHQTVSRWWSMRLGLSVLLGRVTPATSPSAVLVEAAQEESSNRRTLRQRCRARSSQPTETRKWLPRSACRGSRSFNCAASAFIHPSCRSGGRGPSSASTRPTTHAAAWRCGCSSTRAAHHGELIRYLYGLRLPIPAGWKEQDAARLIDRPIRSCRSPAL